MKCSRMLGTCTDFILFNQVSYLLRISENMPLQEWTQEFGASKLLYNFSPVNLPLVYSGVDENRAMVHVSDSALKRLLQPLLFSHTSLQHTYRKWTDLHKSDQNFPRVTCAYTGMNEIRGRTTGCASPPPPPPHPPHWKQLEELDRCVLYNGCRARKTSNGKSDPRVMENRHSDQLNAFRACHSQHKEAELRQSKAALWSPRRPGSLALTR